MSSHNSDEDEPAPEGYEIQRSQKSYVSTSFFDAAQSVHPETMVTIGMFANVLSGRIFLHQSSKLTDQIIAQSQDGSFGVEFSGMATVSTYHTLVTASVLKKLLQTHYFYSKHCTEVLGSNPKRRKRSNDPDLLYKCQMRKGVEGICDAALALENILTTEKKYYNEVLKSDLLHPNFLSSCRLQIEDHKSTLKEQVVNHQLKQRIVKERKEINFLGELCSRLQLVTPLEKPELIEALFKTNEILNHVNKVGKF